MRKEGVYGVKETWKGKRKRKRREKEMSRNKEMEIRGSEISVAAKRRKEGGVNK